MRDRYAETAKAASGTDSSCCASVYSTTELSQIPQESILGLGSGNPVRHANLRPGEVVVDLGSGGGIDVFLAANRVGSKGRVIGVDMTPEMVARARGAAEKRKITNVEFHEAYIEELPLEDGSADVVLSNCVINLSPDKAAVFREAFRVLRPGGRLVISDIVQERPLGDMEDDCGCVANAMVRDEYLDVIRGVGFESLQVVEDEPWLRSPSGLDASAITLRAMKPRDEPPGR